MAHLHRRHRTFRRAGRSPRKSRSLALAIDALVLAALLAPPFAAFAQSSAGAAQQHAHVHGVAGLGVAVQGGTVTLSLESPLDSLIGFEHAPRSAPERAAVAALRATMQAPRELFKFDAEAACSLVKAEAESAIFAPAPAASASSAHADLDASFEYACAQPARLATLDVGLFKLYPRLHSVSVEVATDKGQSKQALTSAAHVVVLSR
jgi:hypothetical protein